MPGAMRCFVTFFGFLTLIFLVQNSIRSLGEVDLLARDELVEQSLRYERALKQSIKDYGESDVDLEEKVIEYTTIKKCCNKSANLNAKLECSLESTGAAEFFPSSMVVGGDFQPMDFMENVTYIRNGECADQVIFLNNNTVEYVLEQATGNLLKINQAINGSVIYNFSQNYCLDRFADESRFVLKLCPCKTDFCIPKCCPQGEYFSSIDEKCVRNISMLLDDELMLLNGTFMAYTLQNCSSPSENYCLDNFLNENNTLEIKGLFCNNSMRYPRDVNKIIHKCCPQGQIYNEHYKCESRDDQANWTLPPSLGQELIFLKPISISALMPYIRITNEQSALYVDKGTLAQLPIPRIMEQQPRNLFCLDRIDHPDSEYAMLFTPRLCLQKCCPPQHFYSVPAQACQFDGEDAGVPVVLLNGTVLPQLAKYFWAYNATCASEKYIFPHAYGTNKVYVQKNGLIVRRIRKLKVSMVPPTGYCIDIFKDGAVSVTNGFFCTAAEKRGRTKKKKILSENENDASASKIPLKEFVLLVLYILLKEIA